MARLEGMRALVTGGTSGIGASIVERFRIRGSRRRLHRTRRGPWTRGGSADRRRVRPSRRARRRRGARARSQTAVAKLGGLDALVANAGVLHEATLSETTDEAWDAVLETNLVGYFRYAVACLPHLRAAGGGSITMISSDAGVWGETAIGAYSVSKRAVNMLVQTLAVEAGPYGIRVNAVCPGDTAPGMATLRGRSRRGAPTRRAGRCRRWRESAPAPTWPARSPSSPRPTGRSATGRSCSSTAACARRSERAPRHARRTR